MRRSRHLPNSHGESVRAFMVSLAAFAAVWHSGLAQPSAAGGSNRGGQQTYQERVNVPRMLIDARVVDHAGKPITGLTAADFVVTIDGRSATVDTIDWVPAERADRTLTATQTPVAAVLSARGRAIVFLYEKKPDLSEVVGLMRVQHDLAAFERIVTPDDHVAILSFDTQLHLWVDFTNDVARIRRAMGHDLIVNSPPRVESGSFPMLRARLSPETEHSSDTIEKAFRVLGDALEPLPGIKSIIVLGYAMGTWIPRLSLVTMANEYTDAVLALQKARVSIFCIDLTRADYHPRDEGLRMIADDTGGFYMRSHIFTAAVFDRLAGALAGSYALLVVPPDAQKGERHIDVRLAHRRGSVFAKRRFVRE